MNRKIFFTINEKPIAWHRPAGTYKRYDSQRPDKMYYGLLINQAIQAHPEFKGLMLQPPIAIDLKFYFALPTNKKLRELKGMYHCQVPDCDNLVKFLLDSFNNILYHDDAYIYRITAAKLYTNRNPRTEVIIKEVMQESLLEKENDENTSVEGSERPHLSSSISSSQSGGVSSSKDTSVKNIIPATVPNDKNY